MSGVELWECLTDTRLDWHCCDLSSHHGPKPSTAFPYLNLEHIENHFMHFLGTWNVVNRIYIYIFCSHRFLPPGNSVIELECLNWECHWNFPELQDINPIPALMHWIRNASWGNVTIKLKYMGWNVLDSLLKRKGRIFSSSLFSISSSFHCLFIFSISAHGIRFYYGILRHCFDISLLLFYTILLPLMNFHTQ